MLKTIVDMGADVNLRNKNGEIPLHAACFKGNKLAVSFLLQKGSNPNVKNSQGFTDCYVAFLRKVIADPLAAGETPLHYAVRSNSKDLALELLRFGADPRIAGDQLQGMAFAHSRVNSVAVQ